MIFYGQYSHCTCTTVRSCTVLFIYSFCAHDDFRPCNLKSRNASLMSFEAVSNPVSIQQCSIRRNRFSVRSLSLPKHFGYPLLWVETGSA